ncbi:MAG: hypothetical protein WCJ64_19260 [Rhodospirillaceae bacterium]
MTAEPSLQTVSRAKSAENRVLIAQLMAKINDGREAEALADCEALSREEEDHPVVLYGLAVLAYQHGQIKTAVEALIRAHERDVYEPLHTEMLAVLYAMAGNLSDATYFAKLSVTRQIDEVTLALLPSSLPPFAQSLSLIKTKPLLSSAEALEAARAYGAAAELYERHLVFFSGDAVAVRGFARCLLGAGRGGQALEVLAGLPEGDPAAAANASLLASACAALGEAEAAAAHHAEALAAAPDDIGIGCAALRDAVFAPTATAAGLAAGNAAWAATLPSREAPPAEPLSGPPVGVGYLVSGTRDIRDLAVVAALVSAMDNRRFKPTFYGYRPNDDPANAVLRHCAGQWRDISECDPYTLAAIVEGDGIDVLVDVGGHGAPNHLAALALRAAPWQVSWLGNPGSLGLGGLDAEFADEHEISDAAGGASRPLLHGLYCRDLLPPSRRPRRDRAMTFGADVAVAQLHPDLMTAWADILAAVPGAMLALRDHGFLEAGLIEPLSRRFQDAGLAERVDVVTGDPAAFYEQVDVALTPFVEINPHNGIEALSQGVPVLALAGAGRHRRQSAALLRRNGLAAFVFEREDDYVAEAVRLGLSADARAAADAAVAAALAGAPLFRPDKVAAGFAAALEALVGLGASS